tara:strand:+ start:888 stop:1478 length:591 start_codon:yes stop_codon:yes gene_type:complete
MKSTYENFIGVYENAFSAEYCDSLIAHYEWAAKNNRTFGRPEQERIKKDDSTVMNPITSHEIAFMNPNITTYVNEFNNGFWDNCYAEYLKEYSVLADYEKHTVCTYKIQKTLPTGGYHVWHCEEGSKEHAGRIGAYLLYLNDVAEGGETEFLYFSKRVKPKKGTLLIFPSNFPWAHRGNPPLSGEKYILTGWVEFA